MADRVGQHLGNYRLERLLGEGGFAEVYLGEHLYLKTRAAIKVLHTRLGQEELEGFLGEARTIAALKHPQIVRVLDFGVEGSTPYLVMDYAQGGTLRQRFPKGTRLPLATVLPILKQVADALQHAHDQRLIHRDIKPENMLLDERGQVVLSDFGIATVAQSSRYQQTGGVAGTAAYMAPEQLQGKPRPASDQYALGIVVYEWLTGERPFTGTFTEIASQHVLTPPPSLREKLPTLSPAVEQVVLTALAKDPRERFASVQAFATAFEQACEIAPPPLHPSAPSTPAPQPAGPVQPPDQPTAWQSAPTRVTPPQPAPPTPQRESAPPAQLLPATSSPPSSSHIQQVGATAPSAETPTSLRSRWQQAQTDGQQGTPRSGPSSLTRTGSGHSGAPTPAPTQGLRQPLPPPHSLFTRRSKVLIGLLVVAFLLLVGSLGAGFIQLDRMKAQNSNPSSNAASRNAQEALQTQAHDLAQTLSQRMRLIANTTQELANYAGYLLSNPDKFGAGLYTQSGTMAQDPTNGQWYNPKTEPASVFLPNTVPTLTPALKQTLNILTYLDPECKTHYDQDQYPTYVGLTNGMIRYYPNIDLGHVVPPDFDVTQHPWFVAATPAKDPQHLPVLSSPYGDATSKGLLITSSAPVFANGAFLGVMGRDVNLQAILEDVLPTKIGQAGYAFLVDQDGKVISMPAQGQHDFTLQLTAPDTGTALLNVPLDQHTPAATQFTQNLAKEPSGGAQLALHGQSHYLAFAQVAGTSWDVVVVRPVAEVLPSSTQGNPQPTQPLPQALLLLLGLTGVLLVVVVSLAYHLIRSLGRPLQA